MAGIPKLTKRTESLLSNKKINDERNDYHAYGRSIPGRPAPLFGQQYKFGKAEATKLTRAIVDRYEPSAQKKVLKEIFARSDSRFPNKGTVALTREGAAVLNKLARQLGMSEHFGYNQPRPIHPVG
jgi:hypothetical protein